MALWRTHLLVILILALSAMTGGADALRLTLTDWRFAQHQRPPTQDVAVVAIDSKSLDAIGVWPWPRTVYADLLGRLTTLGVSDVAFDVDFSSRSTSDSDRLFRESLEAFGGAAVLPIFKQVIRSEAGAPMLSVTRPLPEFTAQSWLGAVNIVPESDGRVRRYATGIDVEAQHYPSLAALLVGQSGASSPAFRLDFSIDMRKIPVVSLADVLAGSERAKSLAGKKVIIGATAIELGDRFAVPVHGVIAGVELQALAADSMLQKRALAESSFLIAVLGLVFIAMASALLRRKMVTAAATTGTLIAIVLGLEGAARLVQSSYPYILDTSYWILAAGGYIAAAIAVEFDVRGMLASIAQKKFQSIAVSLGDGVICTDAATNINFWNPAAGEIFGLPADKVLGRPFSSLLTEPSQRQLSLLLEGAGSPQAMELTGIRQDGRTFPLEVRASSWDAGESRQHSFIARDISSRKKSEERIRFLALNDALTGLPNRASLCDFIRSRIDTAGRTGKFAVLMLDLDNFKEVNDKLGHAGGDELLCRFADTLTARLGPKDFVSRLGGDEFAVVVDLDSGSLDAAIATVTSIFGAGDRLTYIDGQGFLVSTSIGSALYPYDGQSVDELLSHADLALYRAKKSGKALHTAYHQTFKDILAHRRRVEGDLRLALDRSEFELFYQPQVRLKDNELTGFEALIRWRHPERGLIQPGEFLDVLGSSILSDTVGTWILRTACQQAAQWHKAGHSICVGVNLFQSQFTADLPRTILAALQEACLPPDLLEIEITENILLVDDEKTIATLRAIRSLGVRVALDDFGTGFASLTHLKRFPLDRLKVDRSFVTTFGTDHANTAIVSAIVGLGRELGLNTIAEGIEDPDCAELLRASGCCEGQGYHFGRAMPAADCWQLMTSGRFVTRAA